MKFELNLKKQNVNDEDLLKDLNEVAKKLDKSSVSMSEYDEHGNYHSSTIKRRFDGWNNALKAAGLEERLKINISQEHLFLNLEKIWKELGRQPTRREIDSSLSKYSASTYRYRFGSWNNALEAFINYINTDTEIDEEQSVPNRKEKTETATTKQAKRTKREISDRLRFRILMRDGFTCAKCCRSPMKERGVELHVDHIIPWSKGGETLPENLETKCAKCNLGKGNAFSV